ncbi:MAG: DUF1501 domain-containing protein [Pirellulales bacterium]|nr:DUF1501 domain-containing protein [Pirellulales bacterium]
MGLAGIASLSLPQLLALRARSAENSVDAPKPSADRSATAVIVVFLHGGASHLETYDPKPDAPAEYRGPFAAIPTAVPGLNLCELLPRHAQIADKFTLVRSLVHSGFCHGIGQQQMFTGQEVREFKPRSEYPEFLSITNCLRQQQERLLPNYIGVQPIPYLGAAYLGAAYEPFAVSGDPNAAEFSIPNLAAHTEQQRLGGRLGLRRQMDLLRRDLDRTGNMRSIDRYEGLALNMLTSSTAEEAFDLDREDPRTRDRYGRNTWGQQCLLARRLVEHGVDLVTTSLLGPICGRVQNWDDHAVNHHVFNAMQARAPAFDQAIAALVEDLYDRGLDRRVLLIVTGEFGRTPRISYAADSASGVMQPGRDHWPNATSMLFAGGGIATGQVIGATDRRGEQVVERRIGVHDFLATVYRHLGVATAGLEFNDFAGRPIPVLNGGTVVPELLCTG